METPEGCTGAECTFSHARTRAHLLYHIRTAIPTRLKYDDLGLIPSRSDFIDPKLRAVFSAQVNKGGPILFMPNDVIEKNDRVDNQLKYRIYMTGVLPCGSRALLILDGVEVHTDVMVPDGTSSKEFDDFLRGTLIGKNITFSSIKDVHAFKLKGFQKAPRVWKRITFDTLQDRKKCLDAIAQLNTERIDKPKYETAADDCKRGASDYYFPKVAREYRFATADWNRIEKYTAVNARSYSPNCDYVFRVNIRDLKKLSKDKRRELTQQGGALSQVIDRDPTMVAQWDIETWRKVQNGMVPTPKDDDYVIFMLCAAYFWHTSDTPMMAVCCFHTAGHVRAGMSVSVECANERDAMAAHMYVLGKMCPEILSAFNGQNFDWPLYREKLRREKLLVMLKKNLSAINVLQNETEENVLKWCFTSTNIKIDAETKHRAECVAKFPGMIDIDVLPIFLKMYPRMEVRKSFSLNFFLQKNGLESKEDMPFKTMFKIYERARKLAERKPKYRECHCDEWHAHNAAQSTWAPHCACADQIPEIDYKKNPKFVPNGSEPEYLVEYHDDLVMSVNGEAVPPRPKCCQCGKAERNLRDMRDVAYYCTIDTIRPQQLCVKRAIIPDKRELSTMSYVSLYDSFFRADGMKVRNVIGSYAHRRNIAFSNAGSGKTPEEKDHYPGAWVFPPERGLNASRPITGLDFASLYPSLMMCYNLSPDMVVYDREVAEALAAEGYSIHHIRPFNFERGAEKGAAGNKHLTAEGWTVRHNGIFNPKKQLRAVSEYVKTIALTYKITPERSEFGVSLAELAATGDMPAVTAVSTVGVSTVGVSTESVSTESASTVSPNLAGVTEKIDASREITLEFAERKGKTPAQEQIAARVGVKPIRRVKYLPVEGRDPLPGERMGIFAFIVKKLFDKRVPIKAEFVRLSKMLEQMELANTKVWKYTVGGVEYTTTMAEVKFQIAKVDSKQKALKVLANTFYGESGNYLSSIYELLVAAGITGAGQENIKKVDGFITSKGYGPKYGDSVTHDTPVLVKYPSGDIGYCTIDNLTLQGKPLVWEQYGPKLPDGTVKECARTDLAAWSEVGWTAINRVIRHHTDKDIYRVLTGTGLVHVTSDHSLLDPKGGKIKPTEVCAGTSLLHCDLPKGDFIRGKCTTADKFYLSNIGPQIGGDVVKSITIVGKTAEYVYDLETANHHFSAGIGRMIVHNTDSIYTTCPEAVYADADYKHAVAIAAVHAKYDGVRNAPEPETDAEREYKAARVAARIEYWTEMVDITMKVMNSLKEEVSDFLLADNGTCFLNMAYEEVGFPTVLCGKKKYYMTPHIETINFYPKDVFIRGIDIIKQGQTQISKKLGDEFIRESLSPANERELIDIAVDKIRKFYTMKLDPAMFALSAKYNPTKKNVPVITFVNRMKEMQKKYGMVAATKGVRTVSTAGGVSTDSAGAVTASQTLIALYEPPEPGDKFTYVIAKKEQHFTLQGTRIEIKKGDQMEFLRVYNESQKWPVPMELDLNYYIKNAIVGIFARFIAYHPRFQPPAGTYDPQDKDQYKQMDEFCVKSAGKYLEELCDSITGYDKTELKKRGQDYRTVFRRADKAVRESLRNKLGPAGEILYTVDTHDSADDPRARTTRIVEQIKAQCLKTAREFCGDTAAEYVKLCESAGIGVFKLKRIFMSGKGANVVNSTAARYGAEERRCIDDLFHTVGPTSRIIYDYERRFIEIIDEMRAEGASDPRPDQIARVNDIDDDASKNIATIHSLTLRLTTIYMLRERLQRCVDYIEKLRMQKINEPIAPKIDPRELSLQEARSSPVIDEHNWG